MPPLSYTEWRERYRDSNATWADYNRYRVAYDHDRVKHPLSSAKTEPVTDDDDAKVTRHELAFTAQLTADIRAAGEAGWRSPFCTDWPEYDCRLTTREQDSYSQWRTARNDWVATGDLTRKRAMERQVSFTCPPDAVAAEKPEKKPRNHLDQLASRKLARALLAVALVYIVVLALIFLL